MKKILRYSLLSCALSLVLIVAGLTAMADGKPITVTDLPRQAQQTLATHFKNRPTVLVTKDRNGLGWEYEVTFRSGEQVEFDKNGQWKSISCKRSAVPAPLVPSFVTTYVRQHAAGARVIELSRDRKGYEVELSNRTELEFDTRGNLVDVDI